MTTKAKDLTERLRELRGQDEALWDLAVDTADEGGEEREEAAREARDDAAGVWDDVEDALEEGRLDAARELLEELRPRAAEWGDDTPVREAIEALERAADCAALGENYTPDAVDEDDDDDDDDHEVVVRETVVSWRDDHVADVSCYGHDIAGGADWALEAYRTACHEGADLDDVIVVSGGSPGQWIVGPRGAAPELDDDDEEAR